MTILDFSRGDPPWILMNDGVMGGMSSSELRIDDSGTAVFEGRVSFENGGGFAGVKAAVGPLDLSLFRQLEVRVRGDGHTYQLRLRGSDDGSGVAWRARFRTRANEWETTVIPLDSFEATRRGRQPENPPPLPVSGIRQIAFLIGDRQEGPFRLEVSRVTVAGRLDRFDPGGTS